MALSGGSDIARFYPVGGDQAPTAGFVQCFLSGTFRTIVFVGNETHRSYWVPHEVRMTLEKGKPVYAIRINGVYGAIPKCLSDNGIRVHAWSEENLQSLATM